MKFGLFFISLLTFCACSIGQTKYSTTNKKAIKLFEQGHLAPSQSIDQQTNLPNYKGGIVLMNQALEKDPNFWEAHMVAGEFCEYLGRNEEAIKHYEAALSINPNHSPSGSTYYFLASLQHLTGDYVNSNKNIDLFVRNRNANQQLVNKAYEIQANNDFAIHSLASPTNFNPVNIGPGINTADHEYFPTITVDGKTILFTRRIKDERVEGPIKEQEDFFVSDLNERDMWGTAIAMPPNINTINNEGAPTIGPDGRSLVFVACPDATGENYGENRTGKGSCDLFYTKKIGSRWTDPTNIPGNVNSFHWETQPSLSADGKTLYFVRGIRGRNQTENSDIYVTRLQANGSWSSPERLPDIINTPYQEESVLIHPDGKTLYFASRGHVGMGGSDLFVSRLDESGNWSKPVNLGYPINTMFDENSLMVSPDGEIAFFASDRKGGYGGLDIYYFNMPLEMRPTKTVYFEGIVYDVQTRLPLAGKFQLIDIKTGKEVVISEADKVTGEFLVTLPVDREYALNVTYPGYAFFSKNFNMTLAENQDAVHMDVPMMPISMEQTVLLANVFFDLGKATLRSESNIELDKLVDFLQKNPTLKIELGGHTDTRGDDKENLKLSNDRAKAVFDYAIAKGVDGKRLTFKGYGETKPVISDAEIAKLGSDSEKEAAHQSNRRTEYKIIK
ncbi:MAG: OmpA family protein [Crocinitomicaceae bacterium]|jgi:outer membrane protein OmpA-like peptidoglycan-associated protein/tetratricopeptide (TPR) repeat protein|nr:OmpA family protein [Crocinitomicaceae bacterium]MDP4684646.1 OmpA family protein [Crocinitomicaceae bacterium]MDP4798487.1 OmpA family protein [Crocinitomicaceae bacterium]MDP5010366.1 OmpA family protein [Crocinitomicaceae bacterium]